MKPILLNLTAAACLALAGCGYTADQTGNTASRNQNFSLDELKEKKYSLEELAETWDCVGDGRFILEGGRQCLLEEAPGSMGVMIVSPESYGGDVVMRYDVMTLTPATVMVNLLSLAQIGNERVDFPEEYDGGMGFLNASTENYFIAYRNSPHATAPFIKRNPGEVIGSAEKDNLLPGVYYTVEVGRKGNHIWLKVDDRVVVSANDPEIFKGGHLAVRTRGVDGHPAACLIKNMVVFSES